MWAFWGKHGMLAFFFFFVVHDVGVRVMNEK